MTFGLPASSSPTLEYDMISIPKDRYVQFLAHKRASSSSFATHAQLDTLSHNSRANEHMTSLSTSLSNYHFVDTPHSVTLVNGSLSKVANSGNASLI